MLHRACLALMLLFVLAAATFGQTLPPSTAYRPVGDPVIMKAGSNNGPIWPLVGKGIVQHEFSWQTEGTVSGGSCKLIKSNSSTMSSPSDLIATQSVTSSGGGTSLLTASVANYVQLTCDTPISGTGTVTINYEGFTDSPVNATVSIPSALSAKVCDATTITNCAPVDPTNGLKVQATLTPPANQRVNTQSGDIAAGSFAAGSVPNGAIPPLGNTTDGKCTATDTTAEGLVCLAKELVSLLQATLTVNGTITANAGTGNFNVQQNAAVSVTTTMQSGATANGNGTVLATDGQSVATVTANCSACSGGTTLNWEVQNDGSDFTPVYGQQVGTNTIATTTATAGLTFWRVPVAGFKQLRARISGYSAGTVTVTGTTAPIDFSPLVVNSVVTSLPEAAGPQLPSKSDPVIQSYNTLESGAVTTAMTGTTSTQVIPAVASNYLYITACTVSNASTTVSTDIILQDGSGGTTLWNFPAPAAAVATTGGGGGHFPFPVPLKVPTSGNGLYAANVTTGSSTKISCEGFASTVSY